MLVVGADDAQRSAKESLMIVAACRRFGADNTERPATFLNQLECAQNLALEA